MMMMITRWARVKKDIPENTANDRILPVDQAPNRAVRILHGRARVASLHPPVLSPPRSPIFLDQELGQDRDMHWRKNRLACVERQR